MAPSDVTVVENAYAPPKQEVEEWKANPSLSDRCQETVFKKGAVSEWLKEAVLKTVEPQGSGGSNPPCSEKPRETSNGWTDR